MLRSCFRAIVRIGGEEAGFAASAAIWRRSMGAELGISAISLTPATDGSLPDDGTSVTGYEHEVIDNSSHIRTEHGSHDIDAGEFSSARGSRRWMSVSEPAPCARSSRHEIGHCLAVRAAAGLACHATIVGIARAPCPRETAHLRHHDSAGRQVEIPAVGETTSVARRSRLGHHVQLSVDLHHPPCASGRSEKWSAGSALPRRPMTTLSTASFLTAHPSHVTRDLPPTAWPARRPAAMTDDRPRAALGRNPNQSSRAPGRNPEPPRACSPPASVPLYTPAPENGRLIVGARCRVTRDLPAPRRGGSRQVPRSCRAPCPGFPARAARRLVGCHSQRARAEPVHRHEGSEACRSSAIVISNQI